MYLVAAYRGILATVGGSGSKPAFAIEVGFTVLVAQVVLCGAAVVKVKLQYGAAVAVVNNRPTAIAGVVAVAVAAGCRCIYAKIAGAVVGKKAPAAQFNFALNRVAAVVAAVARTVRVHIGKARI